MNYRMIIAAIVLTMLAGATAFAADLDAIPREMLALVNAERAKEKLPPFEFDDSLAAVARTHSADMMANKFFAHESPTTGTPPDRIAAAKIAIQKTAENIAMGLTLDLCHKNLMNSPPHRAAILGDFTHCGIGVVEAPNGMLYITQEFAIFPPAVDLAKAKRDITDKIDKSRTGVKRPALATNDKLDALAAKYADAMAKAGKPLNPSSLKTDIRKHGVDCKSAGIASIRTWNPVEIADTDEFTKLKGGKIGIGFAKNTEHKELGYGMIWTIVIFTND